MSDETRNRSPSVSVLLPVHNGTEYLGETLESLLEQTFADYELIAIDDGSDDGSYELLRDYAAVDDRLRIFRHSNRGIVATLNRAASLARSDILARADADDTSRPDRFERQVQFLRSHPDVGLIGSDWIRRREDDGTEELFSLPVDHDGLRDALRLKPTFMHASVMFRREVFDRLGGYSPSWQDIEDWELWYRMAQTTRLASIPEPLAVYRWHPKSVTAIRQIRQARLEVRLRVRMITDRFAPVSDLRLLARPLIKSLVPDRLLPLYLRARQEHQP